MSSIEISQLAVRLVFLFLPGIVGALIIDILTAHRSRQTFQFIISAILCGTGSYMFLSAIVKLNNKIVQLKGLEPTWEVVFFNSFLEENGIIKFSEVFWATIISLVISIFAVWLINNRIIYRLANFLKLSNKHGEEDLWEAFLDRPHTQWIVIRDTEEALVYQGAVKGFSQKDDKRELLLSDVIIYKEENNELEDMYTLKEMYLSFEPNSKIVIEIQ